MGRENHIVLLRRKPAVETVRVKTGAGNLLNLNGTLYFTASNGTSGTELWKSNGTSAGTVMVLDINPGNPAATIVADLTAAEGVPANSFDCFVLTQTLQFIYDVRAAVTQVHRMLRPGGVVLATVPSVSRIAPVYGLERDYWRFTPASCRVLFGDVFGGDGVTVRGYGNVRTTTAFLSGLAYEELSRGDLDAEDEYFPLIVAIRAVKH